MLSLSDIRVGAQVHNQRCHNPDTWENGIVKKVTKDGVFVVYHCGEDWDHYMDYTAAMTPLENLHLGWRH